MDPLSLCASLLAVTTAAQGCIQGLRKVKQYWKAPLAFEEFVAQIESLQSTLRDVAAVVQPANSTIPPLPTESLRQAVDRALLILDAVDKLFSSPAFHLTRLSKGNHCRAVWLRHSSEIKGLF